MQREREPQSRDLGKRDVYMDAFSAVQKNRRQGTTEKHRGWHVMGSSDPLFQSVANEWENDSGK